ncbi:hypothetical protein ACFWPA_04030 [Rhodococcus sp. NPDC058505]|uniref:hypothetical protein n=1 Tax=unclassified Rhodococcus (in: high G+C Gram-positive bacteria) TaxID=192944 RepID=UPI0036535210
MNLTVLFFLLAAALLVAGVLLREREVPDTGGIGRRPPAQVISLLLASCVVTAAVLTFARLIAMAV